MPDALTSTQQLAARLGASDLVVLDGTYHLPHLQRDPRAEYEAEHIPGAVFFDIDAIADKASPLPHMLPPPDAFAQMAGALGIGNDVDVVVYDCYGLMSAARVWWTLRAFGHDRVAVLDGGLPKWKREGRPVEAGRAVPTPRRFTPSFRPALVRDRAQMLVNLATRREQVVDARSAGRFKGTEPEPRPGLRGGHIPGSRSLPFTELVDPATKTVLPPAALAARFGAAGLDPRKPVVASCGSGVTAAALALGLHLIGAEQVAVYDGSWSEWGLPGDTPVESG